MMGAMRFALACVMLAGCTAGFRSQIGGATTREGASGGTMNSLYFTDRGGPLTKLGLGLLGVGYTAGAVDELAKKSLVRVESDGQTVVYTYWVKKIDVENMQRGLDLIQALGDYTQDYSGVTGELEIASTSLGGDTDGWRFGLGYRWGRPISEHWNIELSGYLSFGSFVHHGRALKTYDKLSGQVMETMGDAVYDIAAVPLRLGFPFRVAPKTTIGPVFKIEPNFYPIFGDDEIDFMPSPWSVGTKVAISYFYAELLGSMSAVRSSATSVNLEVGLAF